MTDLMRNDFRTLYNQANTAHAGLLMQRGLPVWEDGEKPHKKALIEKISSVQADDLYVLAFKRWLYQTYNFQNEKINPNFVHVSAYINGRLYTELSAGSTLETGASTHHTYGMPMLTGSAIKGAVRSYTENLFEKNNQPNKENILNILFGSGDEETDSDNAGYIIWHDAWWIPPINNTHKPFVSEIVTVHHQQYYDGKLDKALDMENSTPNQQIAIQGGFYFTLQGDEQWVDYAKELLIATLKNQGMGAKGSSGYGYFELNSQQIDKMMEDNYKKQQELEKQQEISNKMENASPLMQELLFTINENNWDTSKDNIKKHFTDHVDIWIDKLEKNVDDKDAIDFFVDIFKTHFAKQWKDPNNKKVKPRHKDWVERLQELQSET